MYAKLQKKKNHQQSTSFLVKQCIITSDEFSKNTNEMLCTYMQRVRHDWATEHIHTHTHAYILLKIDTKIDWQKLNTYSWC